MQQPGTSNAAPPRFWVFGENMAFPGQPVLDQAVMTLQELSVGNVQYLNAISSALLKWATVFQRVASDVSSRVAFFIKNALNFISFLMAYLCLLEIKGSSSTFLRLLRLLLDLLELLSLSM